MPVDSSQLHRDLSTAVRHVTDLEKSMGKLYHITDDFGESIMDTAKVLAGMASRGSPMDRVNALMRSSVDNANKLHAHYQGHRRELAQIVKSSSDIRGTFEGIGQRAKKTFEEVRNSAKELARIKKDMQSIDKDKSLPEEQKKKLMGVLKMEEKRLTLIKATHAQQLAMNVAMVGTVAAVREVFSLQQKMQRQMMSNKVGYSSSLSMVGTLNSARASSGGLLGSDEALNVMTALNTRSKEFIELSPELVKTTAKMSAAIGVSADTAANLAFQIKVMGSGNYVKGLRDAGNEMAFFMKNTDLTAQEIDGLMESARPLIEVFPKRLENGLIPQILKLGAAFKELGIDVNSSLGSMQEMTDLTNSKGVVRAALISGRGGPSFEDILNNKDAYATGMAQTDMARAMVKAMGGGGTGLSIASRVTGLDSRSLAQMNAPSDEQFAKTKQRMEELNGIRERHNELTKALNEQLDGPQNSLMGLMGNLQVIFTQSGLALAHFLKPFSNIVTGLSKAVGWIADNEVRLKAAGLTVLGLSAALGVSLFKSAKGAASSISYLCRQLDKLSIRAHGVPLIQRGRASSSWKDTLMGMLGMGVAGRAGLGGVPDIRSTGRVAGAGGWMGKALGRTLSGAKRGGLVGLGGGIVAAGAGGLFGDKVGDTIGGAASGAGLGAMIGSAIAPGIGTAIGGVVGGLGGALWSLYNANAESNELQEKNNELIKENNSLLKLDKGRTPNLVPHEMGQWRTALDERIQGGDYSGLMKPHDDRVASATSNVDQVVGQFNKEEKNKLFPWSENKFAALVAHAKMELQRAIDERFKFSKYYEQANQKRAPQGFDRPPATYQSELPLPAPGDFSNGPNPLLPGVSSTPGPVSRNGASVSGISLRGYKDVPNLASSLPDGLKHLAPAFIEAGKAHNLNPAVLAAISMHETANGTSSAFRNKNNAMGISDSRGPTMQASAEASIKKMARGLAGKTYASADTLGEFGNIYAPVGAGNDPRGLNSYWAKGVATHYSRLDTEGPPMEGSYGSPASQPSPPPPPDYSAITRAAQSRAISEKKKAFILDKLVNLQSLMKTPSAEILTAH